MDALILAAGKGLRLRKILKGKPKPLLKIGNKTLLRKLVLLKDMEIISEKDKSVYRRCF